VFRRIEMPLRRFSARPLSGSTDRRRSFKGRTSVAREQLDSGVARANAAELFAGAGDVRSFARELDWSRTPLGVTTGWSPALRTMARSIFDSPVPICLWSGPEFALIYNDAYRRILAAKHPASLGQPGWIVWAEIWDELQPQFDSVRSGGEPVAFENAPFKMARLDGGGTETAYFNYSLSALRDEDGSVAAVLNITPETTARVLAERRLAEEQLALAASEAEVRKRALDLEVALEQKTLLLHEVDHRVKNNLTMIGALLRLQSRRIGNPEMTEKLEVMMERIDALATVHRRLYQSDDITKFDIAGFAESMAEDVIGASGRTDINLVVDVEAIEVKSDHASSLGLILNEVLTNAIKHGLDDGRAGTIRLFARRGSGESMISIEDDGHGIATAKVSDGLGTSLITRLSKQAGANVFWEQRAPGTRVTLKIGSI
jgi:two-component sensor histidine kinase/PAS domain-containing protein